MSILDNEGHDPSGLGNQRRYTAEVDHASIASHFERELIEAQAEIERLRAALDAILTLDAKHDLPDAWKIAGDVLSGKTWPNGVRQPRGFAVKPYRRQLHSQQSTGDGK